MNMAFQSTRPRRARLVVSVSDSASPAFQSTRPRRARPALERSSGGCAREGRDDRNYEPRRRPKCFNPRAREGRDPSFAAALELPRRFNPRAREGRDTDSAGRPPPSFAVSIHAPAKGATRNDAHFAAPLRVSIHAPAKGATRRATPRLPPSPRFNPRAREGRDPRHRGTQARPHQFQSTRPRRARLLVQEPPLRASRFQSTRPRRARLAGAFRDFLPSPFQSTRPRRARRHLP